MANREACELFIEQEINEGLKKGKTPYSIGQELSEWVVKYFEVRIKPRTLEQRARRQDATNVAKKSKNEREFEEIGENGRLEQTPIDYPETDRGGKREKAGRPTSIQKHIKTYRVTGAMSFAIIAITHLERIRKDDRLREKALLKVKKWIDNNLKTF